VFFGKLAANRLLRQGLVARRGHATSFNQVAATLSHRIVLFVDLVHSVHERHGDPLLRFDKLSVAVDVAFQFRRHTMLGRPIELSLGIEPLLYGFQAIEAFFRVTDAPLLFGECAISLFFDDVVVPVLVEKTQVVADLVTRQLCAVALTFLGALAALLLFGRFRRRGAGASTRDGIGLADLATHPSGGHWPLRGLPLASRQKYTSDCAFAAHAVAPSPIAVSNRARTRRRAATELIRPHFRRPGVTWPMLDVNRIGRQSRW
jgi:hypothetical protein